MKVVASILFYGGSLLTAFFLVQFSDSVDWWRFGGALLLTAAGALRLRSYSRRKDPDEEGKGIVELESSLTEVRERLAKLVEEKEEIGVFGIHQAIDDRLVPGLNRFANARESAIAVYGLDVYAKMMDGFAAAERALNRAWSASADGYIDEVWICLDRATRRLDQVRSVLPVEKEG